MAGRLDGNTGPKRGRPKKRAIGTLPPDISSAKAREMLKRDLQSDPVVRAANLAFHVSGLQAAFRIQRLPKPRERAFELVARRKGISPARLRDILKRDLRAAPHLRGLSRSAREMEEWVRHLMEEWVRHLMAKGTARLDRTEGLAWVSDQHAMDADVQRYQQEKARRRRADTQ